MSRFLFPLDIKNVPERFVVLKENEKRASVFCSPLRPFACCTAAYFRLLLVG